MSRCTQVLDAGIYPSTAQQGPVDGRPWKEQANILQFSRLSFQCLHLITIG
jgi:hypothetical protein